MSSISNPSLSENLNLLNISIQELVDLTDVIILGLENMKAGNIEPAISSICILKELLMKAAIMSEAAINALDNGT